jgi:hypothetical protein
LIIRKATSPWEVVANRVGSDIVSERQSYPLNFRQFEEKDTRPNAPFADGYSTRYSEIINCKNSLPMTTPGSNEYSLGFTQQWIDLGIVTPESIAWDRAQMSEGDDPHPEHYRWRAFERFMKDQAPLKPELAFDLFRLGESDPDLSMGGSMLANIVRHPECPEKLLRIASKSDRDHLRRIATILLAKKTEEAEQAAS